MTGVGSLKFRAHETVKILIHSPEDVPYINHDDDEYLQLRWGYKGLMILQVKKLFNKMKHTKVCSISSTFLITL